MSGFEVKNIDLKHGDKLKIKGKIAGDAKRFQIDLGKGPNDLAMHFNPRFHDDRDGKVIVCNSNRGGSWGSEKRDSNFPFEKGHEIKLNVKILQEGFEVELPNGHTVKFSNRFDDKITYMNVSGDFKVTSFKVE
ncbi:galectin-1-like [Polypterus senegalus]|uniref:galectin-1-like n=1 Tax=Polypterus senegalus TaxID=55291 RepID=UPI001962D9E7|nr:galectin-1-like [Polypterus senegalus]